MLYSLRAPALDAGSALGSGAVVIVDESRDMFDLARNNYDRLGHVELLRSVFVVGQPPSNAALLDYLAAGFEKSTMSRSSSNGFARAITFPFASSAKLAPSKMRSSFPPT